MWNFGRIAQESAWVDKQIYTVLSYVENLYHFLMHHVHILAMICLALSLGIACVKLAFGAVEINKVLISTFVAVCSYFLMLFLFPRIMNIGNRIVTDLASDSIYHKGFQWIGGQPLTRDGWPTFVEWVNAEGGDLFEFQKGSRRPDQSGARYYLNLNIVDSRTGFVSINRVIRTMMVVFNNMFKPLRPDLPGGAFVALMHFLKVLPDYILVILLGLAYVFITSVAVFKYLMVILQFIFLYGMGVIFIPMMLWDGSKQAFEKLTQSMFTVFVHMFVSTVVIFLMVLINFEILKEVYQMSITMYAEAAEKVAQDPGKLYNLGRNLASGISIVIPGMGDLIVDIMDYTSGNIDMPIVVPISERIENYVVFVFLLIFIKLMADQQTNIADMLCGGPPSLGMGELMQASASIGAAAMGAGYAAKTIGGAAARTAVAVGGAAIGAAQAGKAGAAAGGFAGAAVGVASSLVKSGINLGADVGDKALGLVENAPQIAEGAMNYYRYGVSPTAPLSEKGIGIAPRRPFSQAGQGGGLISGAREGLSTAASALSGEVSKLSSGITDRMAFTNERDAGGGGEGKGGGQEKGELKTEDDGGLLETEKLKTGEEKKDEGVTEKVEDGEKKDVGNEAQSEGESAQRGEKKEEKEKEAQESGDDEQTAEDRKRAYDKNDLENSKKAFREAKNYTWGDGELDKVDAIRRRYSSLEQFKENAYKEVDTMEDVHKIREEDKYAKDHIDRMAGINLVEEMAKNAQGWDHTGIGLDVNSAAELLNMHENSEGEKSERDVQNERVLRETLEGYDAEKHGKFMDYFNEKAGDNLSRSGENEFGSVNERKERFYGTFAEAVYGKEVVEKSEGVSSLKEQSYKKSSDDFSRVQEEMRKEIYETEGKSKDELALDEIRSRYDQYGFADYRLDALKNMDSEENIRALMNDSIVRGDIAEYNSKLLQVQMGVSDEGMESYEKMKEELEKNYKEKFKAASDNLEQVNIKDKQYYYDMGSAMDLANESRGNFKENFKNSLMSVLINKSDKGELNERIGDIRKARNIE